MLLLVLPWDAEAEASAEWRYLRRWLVGEARAVFGDVEVVSEIPAQPPAGTEATLVLSSCRVLIGRASLRRMRDALTTAEGRGNAVYATDLTTTGPEAAADLFTLADFERAETAWLAREEHEAAAVPARERRHAAPASSKGGAADNASPTDRGPQLAGEASANDGQAAWPPAEDASPTDRGLQLAGGASANDGQAAWPFGEDGFPAALLSPDAAASCASGRRPPGPRVGLCYEFIDYYGGERADVLPLLPEDLGPASSVLEVGCGRGATGALIKARRGCRVVGVELNPEAAAAAALRLDRVIQGDVQAVEPGETFDAIVAFELFEHLTDGQSFLERAAAWLRPGGRMVFSVPNVGHYSVVEDLIAGRWDYVPMGLLCATHFRFFTRRTLESWLDAAGFDRYRIDAQATPLPTRIDALPPSLTPDRESLATAGFYVSIFT